MNVWTLKTVQDRCKEDGLCWIWQHALSSRGAPQATIEGKGGQLVRRFIYTRLMGMQLPPKYAVVAKCNNSRCVSPDCLVKRSRGVVQKTSWQTGPRSRYEHYVMHAMSIKGSRTNTAKLDFDKARQIRARKDEKATVLAAEFGVTPDAIRAVWRNAVWRERMVSANASVFTWAQKEAA